MSGSGSAAAPDPGQDSARTPGAADAPSGGGRADGGASVEPPAPTPADGIHGQFLVTSDERDAAEARLRQAVADEVLSLEEFGERMRILLAAKTRGDLQRATAGLPRTWEAPARTAQRGHARPARTQGTVVAILGSSDTRGRWRPEHSTTAVALLGDATVDLQGAEYEGEELVINAFSMLGTVEIVVPEGVAVEMGGISILGDRKVRTDAPVVPGTPLVRIDGLALLGDIKVRHPKARERFVPADGRGPFADRLPPATADQQAAAVRRQRGRTWLAAARRRAVGVLVALALALPVGWTLTADEVAPAVFGSTAHVVSAAQLADRADTSVGALMAFGSVSVQVPEGVNVERDGVVIFGSTSCEPCGEQAAATAPTVQIRTVGAFGSVDVVRAPASGLE